MEAIDLQIENVRLEMQKLAQTHIQLLIARNQLVPLHRLPTEILSEIFLFYCCYEDKVENSLPPQHIVCQICSRWRQLAHSLPRLWTKMAITMVHGQFPHHALMAKEWLGRSGSDLPVGISFDVQDDDSTNDTGSRTAAHLPVPRGIIQLCVLPFIHRCLYLVLRLRVDDLIDFFNLPTIHAPHLKTLSLQLADPSDSPAFSHRVEIHSGDIITFNDCPNLINLYLGTDYHVVPVLESMSTMKVPALEELTMEADLALNAYGYRNMLVTCNPKECTMSMSGGDVYDLLPGGNFSGSIITLTRLSLLKVELINMSGFPTLVEGLSLPSLKVISIEYPVSPPLTWEQDHIFRRMRDLQMRSSSSLSSFTLCNSLPQSADELLQFLRLVPSLEALCLTKCNIHILQLANALVYRNSSRDDPHPSPALLPNLSSFQFEDHHDFFPDEEDDGFIANMVMSRWWKETSSRRADVCRLNNVHIRIHGGEFDENALEPMRICRKY
ncbi:hypothetical protein BT96DRAFT_976339, partial [Gymnopus androsaceus JB14]